MTHFTKQNFRDVEADALLADYNQWDILQLKYDGHWCRLEFDEEGKGLGFTTGEKVEVQLQCPELAKCIVIGEHMFGTNWAKQRGREGSIVLFDIVVSDGEIVAEKAYSQRWDLLIRRLETTNHPKLFRAMTKPATEVPTIWEKFILGPQQFEGLVLRNWNQPYSASIDRAKRDIEVTYIAVGFTEGQGKHSGRLGAIQAAVPEEPSIAVGQSLEIVCSVGGGFTDAERIEIWNNQDKYLGREFDATGKQLFESGALRHPNFVRWKS